MQRDMSAQGNLYERFTPASVAEVNRLLEPDLAHLRMRSRSDTAEVETGAVVADPRVQRTFLQRLQRFFGLVRAGYVLRKLAFKLGVLRLYIAAAAFKCRMLGLQEPKVLTKHRRTAVLGDQFLQQFEWSHGLPLRKVASRVGAAAAARQEARDAA